MLSKKLTLFKIDDIIKIKEVKGKLDFSKKQKEILDCKEPIIFVKSAAGSGKTAVLTQRVANYISNEKSVVAFTFTNMAAGELKKRIGVQNNDKVFIGTIHSYCAQLLFRNGITEARTYIEDEEFDKLFALISQHPDIWPEVDCVFCDEAQDSNLSQLKFMFEIIKSKEYFIIYDPRQSIYTWAGARPELLEDYRKKLNGTLVSMNENYRCCPEVLRFAKSTLEKQNMSDDSIAMRNVRGTTLAKPYSLTTIYDIINIGKKYDKWAILTRTNSQLETIKDYLEKKGVPCDTFKQGDLKKEELDERMSRDTVKILTVHSAKGLQWDYVMCVGLNYWSKEECRISYVGITRAKNGVLWLSSSKRKPKAIWSWE